eukprot:TsM_000711300 transcript=TsM_000711300 gene=TsM_000711300
MGNVETSGPNEALVLSGGCFGSSNLNIVVGGWGWSWWCLTDVQRLSLSVMTLTPRCEDVETLEGVAVTVTGVAQVKVMHDRQFLIAACEHFLGQDIEEIKDALLHTIEGHLRAILGTLSVEALYRDRDSFARMVREVATPDVALMGVALLSFTIRDLHDRVEYLDSLGRGQIAMVKRDAEIGVAEAERDAGIQEAIFEKQLVGMRCKVDEAIAESQFYFASLQTQCEQEVNAANAESELALELQTAKEQRVIREEEMEVEVVQRRLQVQVEQEEVLRSQRALEHCVHLPAMAEAARTQMLAEAQHSKKVLEAKSSAEGIRSIGTAKATVLEALGTAEADGISEMAEAFEHFTDASKLSSMLAVLPRLTAHMTKVLSNTKEVVLCSGPENPSTSLTAFVESARGFFESVLPPESVEEIKAVQTALRKTVNV